MTDLLQCRQYPAAAQDGSVTPLGPSARISEGVTQVAQARGSGNRGRRRPAINTGIPSCYSSHCQPCFPSCDGMGWVGFSSLLLHDAKRKSKRRYYEVWGMMITVPDRPCRLFNKELLACVQICINMLLLYNVGNRFTTLGVCCELTELRYLY